MPRVQIPKPRSNRGRADLGDRFNARMSAAVDSRWWHPGAYLLIAVLLIPGIAVTEWLAFAVALISGILSALYASVAQLIEQKQQRAARQAATDAAVADVAAAASDLASVARGIADSLRAVADAGTAVRDALSTTHRSGPGDRQHEPGS